MSRDSRAALTIIVLVWLGVSALGLGTTSLWEPDEPRFAEASRQMLLRGDVLTPYFNGAPRFEKPILFYWMQLPGYALLGVNETTTRLPSALAGLGCLLLTYAIGRRYFSSRAALSGALVLATTFRFVVWTRLGLTDIPVMFWMLAALYCFVRAVDDDPYRPHIALLGWAAVGLGMLTKGPVIVLPLLIVGADLLWRRVGTSIHRLRPVVGVLLAAAIALPWYLWMTWQHGWAFVDFAIGHEILERYASNSAAFSSPPRSLFWYPRIYLGDAAPWTLFVVAAAVWAVAQRRTFDERTRRGLSLLTIWFVTVFVLFIPSRFKMPHYILPAYPASALLTGLFLDRALSRQVPERLWRIPVAVTSIVVLALAGVVAVLLHRAFDTPWTGIGMLVPGAIGAAGAGMLTLDLMRRREAAFHTFVAGLACAVAFLALYTAPHDLQRYQPLRAFGQRVASLAAPGDRIGIYGRLGGPGLIFYGQHNIEWLDDPAQASTFLSGPGRRFCVIPATEFDVVRRSYPAPLTVIERGALFTIQLRRLRKGKPLEERSLLLVSNRP
jgi:4-amino-4-deoxy-L-arabinose transferase-like glycosyltransferase